MWMTPFWEGWGEVRQHDFLCGLNIPVPAVLQASHGTFYLFVVHSSLATTWLTNACRMCVNTWQGRPTISGFESCKVRVSVTLQCIYCMGTDCRVQIVPVAEKAPWLVSALLHWQAVGEAWFLEILMGFVTAWNLVFCQISASGR